MSEIFKIEGYNIVLRTTTSEDMVDYERWNRPDLEAWKFDGPWYNEDLSGVINMRKRWLSGPKEPPYTFLEVETREEVHIGWVTVYHNPNDPHTTEIGIDIVEDAYWGRGLGTEALRLWIDYLFRERNLTRIGLTTWEGNKRMICLAAKLGFVEEACIRRSCEVGGKFYDRIEMGILRSEWELLNKRGACDG
jgi:RimJ/RimL family protein N-acetyltransferase